MNATASFRKIIPGAPPTQNEPATDPRIGMVAFDKWQGNRRGIVTEITSAHFIVKDSRGRVAVALKIRTDLRAVVS